MKNMLTVAKFTIFEIYRSKIAITLIVLIFALMLLSFIASSFGYGAPEKISLDVGLGIMSLSNVIMAIFLGSSLLSKEIEQRTLYMVISRPVSRVSFLLGKVTGLSSVLLINSIALGSISAVLYSFYGGEFQGLLPWTVYFSFYEAMIVMLFAILFSLITNTTLSAFFAVVVYVTSYAMSESAKIWFAKSSLLFKTILDVALIILPNFSKTNLKDYLIYQQSLPLNYLINTQIYLLLYVSALLIAVSLIFKNKNLD